VEELLEARRSGSSAEVAQGRTRLAFAITGAAKALASLDRCDVDRRIEGQNGRVVLACEATAVIGDSRRSLSVAFDDELNVMLDRRVARPPVFTPTTMDWVEGTGEKRYRYRIDRHTGGIEVLYADGGNWQRLLAGQCERAQERRF
jgi:hypothetical protein